MTVSLRTRTCPECGEAVTFQVSKEQFDEMSMNSGSRGSTRGRYIQDILPELSSGDRERFISGICPPCWDELFTDEDDA